MRDVCVAPNGKVYICTGNGSNDKIVVVSRRDAVQCVSVASSLPRGLKIHCSTSGFFLRLLIFTTHLLTEISAKKHHRHLEGVY
jgi:hypothetical protein